MGGAAGCGVNIPWVRGTGMQGKVPVVPGAVCDGAKFPEDIVTATLCASATSWPCMYHMPPDMNYSRRCIPWPKMIIPAIRRQAITDDSDVLMQEYEGTVSTSVSGHGLTIYST